jgi:hypothetical protein
MRHSGAGGLGHKGLFALQRVGKTIKLAYNDRLKCCELCGEEYSNDYLWFSKIILFW